MTTQETIHITKGMYQIRQDTQQNYTLITLDADGAIKLAQPMPSFPDAMMQLVNKHSGGKYGSRAE